MKIKKNNELKTYLIMFLIAVIVSALFYSYLFNLIKKDVNKTLSEICISKWNGEYINLETEPCSVRSLKHSALFPEECFNHYCKLQDGKILDVAEFFEEGVFVGMHNYYMIPAGAQK